jgi:hypothetical protein
MKEVKIFYFLIILLSAGIISCEEQKACTEGCDQMEDNTRRETEHDPNNFDDLINSEYFLKQPIITKENINTSNYNSSQYFDLSVNKNILNYIRYIEAIPYPHPRFKDKQQGNFLHFMHLAYEKNLPLYFGLDQIIYPYIEITKQLNFDIVEFAFHPVYLTFFNKLINYGIKNNYNNDIILYFIIGSKFMYENKEIENNIEINQNNFELLKNNFKICEKFQNDIFSNNENDTNYMAEIDILGKKRSFNKLNFIKINTGFKKGNIISQQITNSLRFFQELIFDASDELYNVYLIGKLIVESGQVKIYKKIKEFIRYIFNEEQDNFNPVELYNYINENFPSLNKTKKEINSLYDKIKQKIRKKKYFDFLNYIDFVDEQQKEAYFEENNKLINLFSYSTSIEDWVNNKMVNYQKGRVFPSILELMDIAFDGRMGRNTLFDRFDKKVNNTFFLYRDGIDMKKELVKAKILIEKSYKEEKDKWLNSYEYSFFYLLHIIGNAPKNNDRNGLIKSFNTIIGSYVHFKKDILLIEQYSNVTQSENGNIPDVYFENNTLFYTEIKEITKKYKEHIIDFAEVLENEKLKNKVNEVVNFKVNELLKAYDNILTILTNNDKNKKDDIIDKMFYYNRRQQTYAGWYVDLYKNNNFEIVFNLDIYAYNYFIAYPIQEMKFEGAIVYEAMNYPEIGIMSIKENEQEYSKKKLYLFSTYMGTEYPRNFVTKVNFKGLQESIYSRRY